MALATLVESPAGILWLNEERGYQPAARWNLPAIEATGKHGKSASRVICGAPAHDLKTGFGVIRARPDMKRLALPAWLDAIPAPGLLVPLSSGEDLLGFVLLTTPRASVEVDWEVRDLLKTASRQAASYLGQLRATEALSGSAKVRRLQPHVRVCGSRLEESRGATLLMLRKRRATPTTIPNLDATC